MFLICTLHAHSPTVRFIPGNIMCKLSVGIDDFFWEGMAAFDRKHPPKIVVINGQINTDVLDNDLLAELEEAFAPEDGAEEPDAEPDGDPEDGGQDSEQDCMSSSKSTSSDSSTSSTSNASNPANNASEDVNAGSDMPVQQQVEDVPAALPKAAPAPKPAPRDAARGSLDKYDCEPYGQLRYKWQDQSMYAHCGRHPSCRISRTCRAGRKQGQGLPLGFLIGWLRGSADEIGGSAAAHRLYQPTYEQRSAGRQWLREQADADWLFELEQGEGDEPLVFA